MNFSKLDPTVRMVLDEYNAAREAKESLGLLSEWRTYEDYCRNKQNESLTDEQPGSVTNVIFPVIASQVSDLVDEPLGVMAIGEEPSDQMFSEDIGHILDWIKFKNKMFVKLDRFEWRRLKFGTSVWKVYYDALNHMIAIEPVSPVNFFPDPKIKEPWHLQEADFTSHAFYNPIPYLKRLYRSGPVNELSSYKGSDNLAIFEHELNEETMAITSNKARVIEHWKHDKDGKLRRIVVGNELLLYDSKKDNKSFYDHGKYPFEVSICYPVEGRLWGMGDVELLKPTQDIINDLDDQIRMNARLMGNIQIVVGLASGINIKKWTNKAGLKIPARDHTAWQAIQPPTIPNYVIERRLQAMREAEIISGRPDVTEGRRTGVRAASAIMALQEAGSRRSRHKKMYSQESLGNVFEFCVDYLKQFFTEEQAWRILGREGETGPPDYLWFRGSDLKTIPKLIPHQGGGLVPLLDNDGKPVTKEAKFDLRVTIGAGLPHNKAFLYQSVLDMVREQIITLEEARLFVRDQLDWPIASPTRPFGETYGGKTGMGGQQQGIPPQVMNQLPDINSIPPEIIQSLIATTGNMGGIG